MSHLKYNIELMPTELTISGSLARKTLHISAIARTNQQNHSVNRFRVEFISRALLIDSSTSEFCPRFFVWPVMSAQIVEQLDYRTPSYGRKELYSSTVKCYALAQSQFR